MTSKTSTTADLRVICAWCGTELHAGSLGAPTSHGMCPSCEATFAAPRRTAPIGRLAYPVMVFALLLSLASPAFAVDWKPLAVLTAGQMSDLVTTIHENPGRPCVETNRLLGAHPSVLKVAIPKLAIIGGVALLLRFTESRDSKAAKVIAKSAAYLGGGVGAKDGFHNFRTCGW